MGTSVLSQLFGTKLVGVYFWGSDFGVGGVVFYGQVVGREEFAVGKLSKLGVQLRKVGKVGLVMVRVF